MKNILDMTRHEKEEWQNIGKEASMEVDRLQKNEKILENCNFIKTILMLLVIFGHACSFWTGGGLLQKIRRCTHRG